jgi:hypothetical protein
LQLGFGRHEDFVRRASNRFFVIAAPKRGLPPRIYLPIVAVIATIFLGAIGWLLHQGLATGGSEFGAGTSGAPAPAASGPPAVSVEGGPPATVRVQLQQLRDRIARAPKDDVALTQLGDLYLAVDKYSDAIPYYVRALAANPHNVAAREGLSEARAGLQGQ